MLSEQTIQKVGKKTNAHCPDLIITHCMHALDYHIVPWLLFVNQQNEYRKDCAKHDWMEYWSHSEDERLLWLKYGTLARQSRKEHVKGLI
jgi:hypothetical protein